MRLHDLLNPAGLAALARLGECALPLPWASDIAAGEWVPPELAEIAGGLARSAAGEPADGEAATITCRPRCAAIASLTVRVDLPPGPVMILDGTASAESIRARASGREVRVIDVGVSPVEPDAVLRLRLVTGSWSRSACRRRGWAESARLAVRLVNLAAEAAASHLGGVATRVGIITHAPLAKELGRRVEASSWAIGWFGCDDRGTNRFELCNLVVVLGDPILPLTATALEAESLGLEAATHLAAVTAATIEQVTWRARSLRRTDPHAEAVVGRILPPGWASLPVVELVDPHDPISTVAIMVAWILDAVERHGIGVWPASEFVRLPIGGLYRGSDKFRDRRRRAEARTKLVTLARLGGASRPAGPTG